MGVGPAYGRVVSQGNLSGSTPEITYTGLGVGYELMMGGTLSSGVVLGGGLLAQDIVSPKVETKTSASGPKVAVDPSSDRLGIALAGLFVDWFPIERAGAHVGAMLGLGRVGLQDSKGNTPSGGGASLFGGYDFWVGSQWSLGLEGRALAVRTERDVPAVTFEDSALGFQLLVSALYH